MVSRSEELVAGGEFPGFYAGLDGATELGEPLDTHEIKA